MLSGFSLGGNIVAKYVGEEGIHCPLKGVVVLANPWNFRRGSDHIEDGTLANRYVYRYVMGGALLTLYQLHRKVYLSAPPDAFPMPQADLEKVLAEKKLSLKEFDDVLTSPMWGFDNAHHYYTEISSSKVAENVSVPLLSINARDDPMVADLTLPLAQVCVLSTNPVAKCNIHCCRLRRIHGSSLLPLVAVVTWVGSSRGQTAPSGGGTPNLLRNSSKQF